MQSDMEMKGIPPPYSHHPPPNPTIVVASQPVLVASQPFVVANQPAVVPSQPSLVINQPAVMGHPSVMVVNQMGPSPTSYVCKSCNAQIVTRMERKPSMRTHIFALILCCFGCWPCVCVPYCVDSCNNADHYCPNCNAYLGSYIN